MLRKILGLALGKRLPIVSGTLRVPGVRGPVTIRRDGHGIPYVEASNEARTKRAWNAGRPPTWRVS